METPTPKSASNTACDIADKPPYQFSKNWFDSVRPIFESLFSQFQPVRVLEVGSFEGASTCFMIDTLGALAPLEIHCIDTWEGGVEHQPGQAFSVNMGDVERRFRQNIDLAVSHSPHPIDLQIHKGSSVLGLAKLLAEGKTGWFDFVYIDGSHQAPDVLTDAVLAFQLVRTQGVVAFDDYLWSELSQASLDPLRCPKLAIDVFTNVFARKVKMMNAPLTQIYLRKLSD